MQTVGHDPHTSEWLRANPEEWAIRALGIEAWRDFPDECEDQIALFKSIFANRRTACKAGHKAGKSFTVSAAALAWLVLYPGSKVITTAPTGRQVDEILWQEIRQHYSRAATFGCPIGGNLRPAQSKLTFGPGWFGLGFATDKEGEGVQAQGWSGEHVLFIFDEAGGVPKTIWETANTALQDPTSHIVAVGNPHDPSTPFYDACASELWHTMTMNSRNSPNCRAGRTIVPGAASLAWCDEMLATLGESDPQYQFRVLGQFPEGSAFSLISLAACEAAQARTCKPGHRTAGVDVARFGDDRTAIFVMDGGQITHHETLAGCDTLDVAGRVATLYREHQLELVAVDDTGVGGGVTDALVRDKRIQVLPVNFGESANDSDKYANIVTEMYTMLAADLRDGALGGLPRSNIVRELTGRQYKFTLKQQMQLEPKKDFKKRIGRSPDETDALALANFARRMCGSDAASAISGIFA